MRPATFLTVAVMLLVLVGCDSPVIPPCEETCDLCCEQESTCTSEPDDGCYDECLVNCQRSSRVYSHTTCFDAKLAVQQCTCALSCSELDDFESGAVDHCSDELATETDDCAWF